jgi:hypothetical protein
MGTTLLEGMADILRMFVQALELFALTVDRWLHIPWPLVVAAFFPPLAFVLAIVVWWLRGAIWPVACEYQTTRRAACRNPTLGEWHRCWQHNWRRLRKTDLHRVQPKLRRWQTISRGVVKERTDIHGRGFLRLRSNRIGLLYYRGFARPPRDVFRLVPQVARDRWHRLQQAAKQVQQLGLAGLFGSSSASPSRLGVSALLPSVISATRFTLLLLFAGLGLVVVAVLLTGGLKASIEYGAAFLFIGAWMVVKNGIIETKPSWPKAAWAGSVYAMVGLVSLAALSGLIALWAQVLNEEVNGDGAPNLVVVVVLLLLLTTGGKRRRRRWKRW